MNGERKEDDKPDKENSTTVTTNNTIVTVLNNIISNVAQSGAAQTIVVEIEFGRIEFGRIGWPGTHDQCGIRTTTDCTSYVKHAKRMVVFALLHCTGPG